MAKNKIERIDQEIAKTREKIAEQQEKLKALEAQKTEAENLEIVQMVRAVRMTPAQLNALLSGGIPSLRAQRFYLAVLRWSEKQEVQSTSPVHFLSKAAKQQFFFAQGQMIQSFFSRKAVSTMAR